MHRYLFGILAIVLAIQLSAQPGYMGRKFSAGYSLEAFPWINPVRGGTTYRLVTGHHVNAALSLSRKCEFFTDAGLRTLDYALTQDFSYDGDIDISFTPLQASLKALEISGDAGLRYYFKEFVAPIGIFHEFSAGFVMARFRENNAIIAGTHYTWQEGYMPMTVSIGSARFTVPRISYGLGMKRIINHTIFFIIDGHIHVPLYKRGSLFNSADISYAERMLRKNSIYNAFWDTRFGVGILF
jgi:hypothetical protein